MVRKTICIIGLCFLLLFDGVLVIQNLRLKNSSDIENKTKNDRLNWEFELLDNGKKLETDILLIDTDSSFYYIHEFIHEDLLIFYFDEKSCFTCVEHYLQILSDFIKNIELNVIVIANYAENREFHALFSKNQYPFPCYNLQAEKLNLNAEKLSKPFFFCLNTSLSVIMNFVPAMDQKELTIDYLSIVYRRNDLE